MNRVLITTNLEKHRLVKHILLPYLEVMLQDLVLSWCMDLSKLQNYNNLESSPAKNIQFMQKTKKEGYALLDPER